MLLPIILWGSRPPSHSISCVFLSRDDKVLISGSKEGQLLVSDVFPTTLVPRCFLMGHSSEVIGVAQLQTGLSSLHVASASVAGEVFKWNVSDGSYMVSTTLQGPLTSLKALPSSQNLLVCGQYGSMTILDAVTLEAKHYLIPSDPTHWVLCHAIFQPPKTKDEEVVCLTLNGQVKTWHLQSESKERYIVESESKMLNAPSPNTLCYNPRSLYNCLVVCDSAWRIYRAGDFVLLCTASSNKESPWRGGAFYQLDKVILWKENGALHVYKLPSRAIRPVNHSDSKWTAEPPICIYKVQLSNEKKCVVYYKKSMRTPHDIVIRGSADGTLTLWKRGREVDISEEGLGEPSECSLPQEWSGEISNIVRTECDECLQRVEVSASTALEPLYYVACGLSSGPILVGSIHSLMSESLFDLTGSNHVRLRGHSSRVTCLLYPHSLEPTAYGENLLYSGSEDFSVKIWDWQRETLLQTFTVHSGPVVQFLLPPVQTATGRVKGSVISICSDHSVAITKHNQSDPLFFGPCHHTSIMEIRWRHSEDIILVHCTDDTVYVWGLSTGHLDRIEHGSVALNILAPGCPSSRSDPHVLRVEPPGSSFPKETTGLRVVPFRFSENDIVSHMVVFDTELLLHLLSQLQGTLPDSDGEVPVHTKSNTINFDLLRRKVVGRTEQGRERRGSLKKQTETTRILEGRSFIITEEEEEEKEEEGGEGLEHGRMGPSRTDSIRDTCTVLLSCLHAWGVDLNIDRTCLKHLGLLAPSREVHYGTISSKSTFMLMVPGWEERMEQLTPSTIYSPFGRWCVSSTLTTQHLLTVSALANKQMSTDLTLSFNHHIRSIAMNKDNVSLEREELLRQSINESEKKAGWSHVTALHCIVLPEHVPSGYCSPLLPHLAIKWQDRCMEVREAAQALFLRELRRIGFAGRQQLVGRWYPYIVRKRDTHPTETTARTLSLDLPVIPEYFNTFLNTPERSVSSVSLEDEEVPSDFYSVSVIILGVVVAEFGDEVEIRRTDVSPEKRDVIRSSFLLTYDMLRMVGAHLFGQLTKPTSQLALHSPVRRASVDLIGRGFSVWSEFMNLTAVLMTLIELQTDPTVPLEIKKAIAQSGNIPATGNKERLAAAATVRAAYQACILIANQRPQQSVNALSKEILTFKCDVEAGLSIQSNSSFPSSYHLVLDKGRYPVYLLVQNVIEKTKSRELVAVLVKIVEIMLFCIDVDQFKTRTLGELIPSLTKNPLIDYCASTQQVAVGSVEGLVHVFDIRSGKCTPLHCHSAPTSAVTFSSNGRALVTFSDAEGKVSIWQSSAGLLSLMSPGPLKFSRTVEALPPLKSGSRNAIFKWEAPKLVSLYTVDGVKKSFGL